jgi:hypothetical protein
MKINLASSLAFAVLTLAAAIPAAGQTAPPSRTQPIEISIAAGLDVKYPLTGRVLVCIAKIEKPDTAATSGAAHGAGPAAPALADAPAPCNQIEYDYTSQQIFGQDVTNLAKGPTITLNETAFGYPISHLRDFPAGEYRVEATFNVYEDFHLASGHTLSLPPDRGEGQHWNSKPGNPISTPVTVHLDPASKTPVRLILDKVNPPVAPPDADTKYMKYVSMRSEMLSKFWGRDTFISAWVLLPPGFDEHPDAHYPELIWQDHFAAHFRAGAGWRDTPPDPKATGNALRRQQSAYNFYLDWTSGRLPKMLIIQPNHANPYFDDSYAVNSANVGPYGDAITQELLPSIEKQYRGIGQGWARVTSGGSTGGWEALAVQIFYPDYFNGT